MADVASIQAANQAAIDAIWEAWGDLTRFHLSTRIAMQRELDVWTSVRVHSPTPIKVSLPPGAAAKSYELDLDEHLTAIASPEMLASLVLIQSWSLAESLGRVGLARTVLPKLEVWAAELVTQNGKDVSSISGGLGAVVESYIVRNSIAHSLPTWTPTMAKRLTKAGGTPPEPGTSFDLSDESLYRHRAAVRALMNRSGLRRSAT